MKSVQDRRRFLSIISVFLFCTLNCSSLRSNQRPADNRQLPACYGRLCYAAFSKILLGYQGLRYNNGGRLQQGEMLLLFFNLHYK